MRVGVTGGRDGATAAQLAELRRLLVELNATELHHGDCLGADAQAHDVAVDLGLRTVSHPPKRDRYRAYKAADETRDPRPYMLRNADVIRGSDLLVALPGDRVRRRSGGTWRTYMRAGGMNRPRAIIWPDGRRED